MKSITEKDDLQKQWYEEAHKQTLETLPDFLKKLTEDYGHDYGTICHAVAAAALGAANAVNHAPCGGITGFQSGAVMWEFISEWQSKRGKPLRLLDYSNMLYPQYEDDFTSISQDTWKWLQAEAKKLLGERSDAHSGRITEHWQSIAAGKVPFGFELSDR